MSLDEFPMLSGETLSIPELKGVINPKTCVVLRAGIDAHVHFRTPGHSYKEDWRSGSLAALEGGYVCVGDMPNTVPPTTTLSALQEKISLIQREKSPLLDFKLYFGAEQGSLHEIYQAIRYKERLAGLKIFMGSSTGSLLVKDDETLHQAFKIAADCGLMVAVHAEDEDLIEERKRSDHFQSKNPITHSKLRNDEVAAKALKRALRLAEIYGVRLYALHLSTKKELDLIRDAKSRGGDVFAEATPHHLFLNETMYQKIGAKALVNPPLRGFHDQEALWQGISDQTIDTIGSDHAPHLLKEKSQCYGEAPAGFPGLEWTLPLLCNAYNQGRISLERIEELTHKGPCRLLGMKRQRDYVVLDLAKKKVVTNDMRSKAGWTPYEGLELQGWPVAVLVKGHVHITKHGRESAYA